MGGFFLINKTAAQSVESFEKRHRTALDVFEKKGLRLADQITSELFILSVYQQMFQDHDPIVKFKNGDFVASIGACIYEGKTGPEALNNFHDDFVAQKTITKGLCGNFCILIYHRGHLNLLTDYFGYYRVYSTPDRSALSSSFLALAKYLPRKRIAPQEFYEYVFNGFFVRGTTLLDGIEILDSRHVWQLVPTVSPSPYEVTFEALSTTVTFEQAVERIGGELFEYFRMISAAFENRVGSALSGGYDTRLMLAVLRRAAVKPVLYVYGNNQSSDVVVAKAIARGEELELEHIDKSTHKVVELDAFPALTRQQFYFFDGLKSDGIFDDGSDLETRIDRSKKAILQLNGAGGEIYREIWNVGDRELDIGRFLQLRFDFGDYSFCRSPFNKQTYFERFAEKVKDILGIDGQTLTRTHMEMLFPFLRNMYAAFNNGLNNQISPALLPFVEPRFVYPSYQIPIRWKFYGRFNEALLRAADPSLASYQSSYGHDFSHSPSTGRKLKKFAEMHVPFSLRLFKRTHESKKRESFPYYLQDNYVEEIFGGRPKAIDEFVDIRAITDPLKLSRALSVELIVSELM